MWEAMKDKGGFYAHLDPHKVNFIDNDLIFRQLPDGIKLTFKPASELEDKKVGSDLRFTNSRGKLEFE